MSRYCFCIKLRLLVRVSLDEDTVTLLDEPPVRVTLRPADGAASLSEATEWKLDGEGYSTSESARAAGEQWAEDLRVAFASNMLPVDFGDRDEGNPDSSVRACTGVELPTPVVDSVGTVAYPAGDLLETLLARARQRPSLTREWRIAYHLWSASHAVGDTDSAFLLLMMAVETLLSQQERDQAAQRHIDDLQQRTRDNTELADADRRSLCGALKALKKESVGQAGKRLAQGLEPKRYEGQRPQKFFATCYQLRSDLVHGTTPRPETSDLIPRVTPLRGFVADLLRVSLGAPVGAEEQQPD